MRSDDRPPPSGADGATPATCRACGTGLSPGLPACPACGTLVAASTGPNVVLSVFVGVGVAVVLTLAATCVDIYAEAVNNVHSGVYATCVVVVLVFLAGLAALVRGRTGLGFLLVTAGFVASVPTLAIGIFSLACTKT